MSVTIETAEAARSPEPTLVAAGTTPATVRAGVDADFAAVEAGRVTVEAAAAAVVVAAAVVASAADATCVAPPLAAGAAVPTVLVGGAAADARPGDGARTAWVTAPSVEASGPAARAGEVETTQKSSASVVLAANRAQVLKKCLGLRCIYRPCLSMLRVAQVCVGWSPVSGAPSRQGTEIMREKAANCDVSGQTGCAKPAPSAIRQRAARAGASGPSATLNRRLRSVWGRGG